MENDTSIPLLNDVEAQSIALIRREQEVNNRLVRMELLMKRYQIIHSIALLLFRSNKMDAAKKQLLDSLISTMHFQKTLIYDSSKNNEVEDSRGISDEVLNKLDSNKDEISMLLNTYFEKSEIEFDGRFIVEDKKAEELIGLGTFLVGKFLVEGKNIYIFIGYDSNEGAIYKAKYPLSNDDISWLLQLVVLWSSFIERAKLFDELKNSASSSLLLAEQKEKQIEERTRALLDALFDAKKFKLALELADAAVLLVDASSHKIIYANELFEKISGYKRDKFVGRKTLEFLRLIPLERGIHLFSTEFESEIKEKNVYRGKFIFISEDESEHELVLSISRFAEEGGGSVYVVIGRDVTSERNIEKQEQKYAEDIKKLNQLIVNRELRIIELKQRIAGLIK